MFSFVANFSAAQDIVKDVVTEYEDGHEVLTEHILPSYEADEHVIENFTRNTKNDSIMEHSLKHKGEIVYVTQNYNLLL